MQQSPWVIFINLNKYWLTCLYLAGETSGCTFVFCTFSFFFPSLSFLFYAAIPAQSPTTKMANHSPAEIQPSGGREQNSTGTKVNNKQDADPELFLNQPELIHHFNLHRRKMDPNTHTVHTWTDLLVPL